MSFLVGFEVLRSDTMSFFMILEIYRGILDHPVFPCVYVYFIITYPDPGEY